MSMFGSFALSFGALLCLAALIASWMFRSSTAPLLAKIAVPALIVALACVTPYRVAAMMGWPVQTTMEVLPQQAELVAFVPHEDTHRVILWLRSDGADPRSYDVALTEGLKKTLAQAMKKQSRGERVGLMKKGIPAKHPGVIDIDGGKAPYVLDPNAFSLPPKDGQ